MAIWDDLEISNNNEDAWGESKGRTKSLKCPGCGSGLRHEPHFCKLACRSCGSLYDPTTLELDGVFSGCTQRPAGEEDADKTEYICGSCGATIVCKKEVSATFCAHCGSSTLIKRRLEYEFAPEFIIPFKNTKEEALTTFRSFLSTNKSKPGNFGKNVSIEDVVGVYVPFWLVSSDIHADLFDKHGTTLQQSKFTLRNVPFDWGRGIDNFLMRALEPYDYSELVPYNDNYLSGYYAERYNETPFELAETIEGRFSRYADDFSKTSIVREDEELEGSKVFIVCNNLNSHYGLLPVWFLSFEYEGVRYQFGINGQTGEVSGEVPVSKKVKAQKAAVIGIVHVIAIIITIALYVGGVLLWPRIPLDILRFLIAIVFLLGGFYIAANIIVWVLKIKALDYEITNELDDEPDFYQYLDFDGDTSFENKDYLSYRRNLKKDTSSYKDIQKDNGIPSVIFTMFNLIGNLFAFIDVITPDSMKRRHR